ncbi:hypothetical protein CP985_12305 [Malaciobacter mytili LMG 24559]|uniref:Response regulatory domain-containing protein n=1 Tax=Malaciobacter mytili LMG 24559 TaxID=1032238 RepID=A0AAX2AGX2_9BACT|nr:response regulator [Malaciobacter mytili]AXH15445.1 signal transduction response regulator [Malaciobacter mytili LMG 24559]RXK14741.1 hypothetical protein CP985_12305 [Malaciobacter mytili LMG 24559]
MDNFKILIVDDNKLNIYSLKLLIEDNFDNLDIYEALSVKEAFKIIDTQNIHLILSDIQMPQMDGFEFIEKLHSFDKYKNIPIIFITGIYNDSKYLKKGYKLGAIDYITKPIDDEILTLKLNSYMQLLKKASNEENEYKNLLEDMKREDKKDEILENLYK